MATLDELRAQLASTPQYAGGYASGYSINPNYTNLQRQIASMQEQQDPFSMNNLMTMLNGSSAPSAQSSYGSAANPWLERLKSLVDNPDSIDQSAAYKFRLGQGQQAVERSAAAKGMTGSGNTLAALTDYGQGQASQEYGNQLSALSSLYGTAEGANASRYGSDQASAASNRNALLSTYGNIFTKIGAPGSLQRRNGLLTTNQGANGLATGGW